MANALLKRANNVGGFGRQRVTKKASTSSTVNAELPQSMTKTVENHRTVGFGAERGSHSDLVPFASAYHSDSGIHLS